MSYPEMKSVARLYIILALVLASGCAGRTAPIEGPKSIASLEKASVGGISQWLLIRGRDVDNPVLLFLHGGPGSPEMPVMPGFSKELEERFIVVHWDQRGAGKTNHISIPKESFTIQQFINDAHELTGILKKRFDEDKIYLVGHSWGSLLGTLTAHRYPEDYHAYVGIGQCVDMQRNESISYNFALDQARKGENKRAARELESIGPPPYRGIGELIIQRKWLQEFGGATSIPEEELLAVAFSSTEYAPQDYIKFVAGTYNSIRLMWPEIMKKNLML